MYSLYIHISFYLFIFYMHTPYILLNIPRLSHLDLPFLRRPRRPSHGVSLARLAPSPFSAGPGRRTVGFACNGLRIYNIYIYI